jgi:5-dehydro-2-deoxygluconokinase
VIAKNDAWCRGVVLLGLDAPEEELAKGFSAAAAHNVVKGFAVGRTIFSSAAQQWLRGQMTDEEATADMAARFGSLVGIWKAAR